ncbi:MAG: carbon storage regulator [Elusimicrobia bacterium]|nr:carbon storage regulator [Elusimicrobiota bacterium]
MLLLTRRLEESLLIGTHVEVKVLAICNGHVTLGIKAPPHIPVHRREIFEAVHALNRAASDFNPADLDKASHKTLPKKR